MFGTEGFDLWWLIPIMMIVLCIICSRGCCFGRRESHEQRRPKGQRGPPDSALRILDRRYASGEIDNEEYRRRKNNIFPHEEGATP